MLSLFIVLAVFCLFEARVPELDTELLPPPPQLWDVQCTLYTEQGVKLWGASFELAQYI
jgi:hypothetical protein